MLRLSAKNDFFKKNDNEFHEIFYCEFPSMLKLSAKNDFFKKK